MGRSAFAGAIAPLGGMSRTLVLLSCLLYPSLAQAEGEVRQLKARVDINDGVVKVTNLDRYEWRDCLLELNPGTRTGSGFKMSSMAPGTSHIIQVNQFASSEGYRFNLDTMKPLNFRIRCGARHSVINPPSEHITSFEDDFNTLR